MILRGQGLRENTAVTPMWFKFLRNLIQYTTFLYVGFLRLGFFHQRPASKHVNSYMLGTFISI